MADSRVFTASIGNRRTKAGIISRIQLENFMCHSNLEIEFGDWVNFVTGQNGSEFLYFFPLFYVSTILVYFIMVTMCVCMYVGGKSAILTALCVAFGCRARGTQRASTLKDFIKTGCG